MYMKLMMSLIKYLFLINFIYLPAIIQAQVVYGVATYISDGDTFRFLASDGIKLKVRVADIDCPEKVQPYGLEAKEFVLKSIEGKEITLNIQYTDRYGRKVARVGFDNKDLSEELLRNGLAWHYKKHSKEVLLAMIEQKAKDEKV